MSTLIYPSDTVRPWPFVAILILALTSGCFPKRPTNQAISTTNLLVLIDSLPVWQDGDFTEAEWSNVTYVAKRIQTMSPAEVRSTLDTYIGVVSSDARSAPSEESKAFILLRVVFDLPEHALPSQRFSFFGWIREDPRGGSRATDVNPDGTVNLSWPLVWRGGRPAIVTECVGALGAPYAAGKEYLYMLEHFPQRRLK